VNPSQARDSYDQAKRKYDIASATLSNAKKSINTYTSERNTATARSMQFNSEKSNLEKRLSDVVGIIGLLGNSVEMQISSTNTVAQKANYCYSTAIKCTGIPAVSIFDSFHTKGVEEEVNSNSAMQGCLTEKTRIENEIARLTHEINNLEATIKGLTQNLNNFSNVTTQYTDLVNRSYNEMAYYKKFF
jgi:chromosome segregation ATPase